MKIMIADDSAFMRKMVRNILAKLKYTDLVETANGRECIEKFKTEKPDLLLLDIIMPDIGGIDVLREVKQINPQTKVIMVTAVGQEAMIEECKKLGALDYITKPFNEKKVSEAIKKVLKP